MNEGGLAIMYGLPAVRQAHSPLHVESCLILTTTPWSRYDYPHFTDGETEAHMTCPWSQGSWAMELRLKPCSVWPCRLQGCTAAAELNERRGVSGTYFRAWPKAEAGCMVSLAPFSLVPFPGPQFSHLESSRAGLLTFSGRLHMDLPH